MRRASVSSVKRGREIVSEIVVKVALHSS